MSDVDRKKVTNWRNVNVFRNRKYEPVVDQLCTKICPELGRPVFEYNKDLMIFAAMIGHSNKEKESLEKGAIQITLATYASDEKDGYIFLLGLLEKKSMGCLKAEELNDTVRLFEEYCNGGLSIIRKWLEDAPEDACGLDTIMDKIQEEYVSWASDEPPVYDRVEF